MARIEFKGSNSGGYGISREEFFDRLRQFRWQEPFVPFRIELTNGETIEVEDARTLAFNAQFGVFDSPRGDSYEFTSEEVARIVPTETSASR